MKTKLTTILIILSIQLFSQESVEFSFYSSMNFSRGAEIRGDFENWFISIHGENFIQDETDFLNWGFAVGIQRKIKRFNFLSGIRVGFIDDFETMCPSYGIEIESDYFITNEVFVAIRYAHDRFLTTNEGQHGVEVLNRPFLKIGYKF